jgi:integrase
MSAPYKRTRHPGIYSRGSRYVVTVRINGRKRERTTATLAEARALKAKLVSARDEGGWTTGEGGRVLFADFALDWIARYQGNGKRGFSEETREAYKRDLEVYAIPYFGDRLGRRLNQVSPADVDSWVAWLAGSPNGKRLADATIKRIVAPVRACLATARREGLVAGNSADKAVLPVREQIEDDDAEIRVLSRDQLDAFLRVVRTDHKPLFQLLASSGLRWSEAAALRRKDLVLDGPRPVVKVRRSLTKGGRIRPPKTRHGKRDVPLSADLVRVLKTHLAGLRPDTDDALAFPGPRGGFLSYENVRRRALKPAAEEAGASWMGFHSLRHGFASMHLARGTNILALSRLMGHASAEFTLKVYGHKLPGDDPAALDLAAELAPAADTPDPADQVPTLSTG